MQKRLVKIFLLVILATAFFAPQITLAQEEQAMYRFYNAKITEIEKKAEEAPPVEFEQSEIPESFEFAPQAELLLLKLKILSGDKNGQEVLMEWSNVESPRDPKFSEGQKIIIGCSEVEGQEVCNFSSYDRLWSIIALFILLLIVALAVAGKKAMSAALTLALSLIIVISVMVPLVLKGYPPFYLALIGGGLILLPSVYLAHGLKMRSHIALVSLLAMILLVSLLSLFFASNFRLLGFSGDEATFLNQDINLYAIMIGGLVLATIGVLDDVVITQISVVEELFHANRNLSARELFSRSMKIGRDHIYTVVNTLFLVYAGVSLPALILIQQSNVPLIYAIQNDNIATEIVRTGVGTMGLILALPLATLLTCYFITKKPDSFEPHDEHSHSH